MAIRRTIINGYDKVWLARVAYQGLRRAKVCRTKDAARQAESDLLQALKAEIAKEAEAGARPATLRQLLDFYVADLAARGRKPGQHRASPGDPGRTRPAHAGVSPQASGPD
jgi:hypothetical protein